MPKIIPIKMKKSKDLAEQYMSWRGLRRSEYEELDDWYSDVKFFAGIFEDILTLPTVEAWEKTRDEKNYIFKDYKRFLEYLCEE